METGEKMSQRVCLEDIVHPDNIVRQDSTESLKED